jgi:hypothetical protein
MAKLTDQCFKAGRWSKVPRTSGCSLTRNPGPAKPAGTTRLFVESGVGIESAVGNAGTLGA